MAGSDELFLEGSYGGSILDEGLTLAGTDYAFGGGNVEGTSGSIFDSFGDALNGLSGLAGSFGNLGESVFGALGQVQNAKNEYKNPTQQITQQQLLIYGIGAVIAIVVLNKVLS